VTRSSSADEIANVHFLTTISYTYYKTQ